MSLLSGLVSLSHTPAPASSLPTPLGSLPQTAPRHKLLYVLYVFVCLCVRHRGVSSSPVLIICPGLSSFIRALVKWRGIGGGSGEKGGRRGRNWAVPLPWPRSRSRRDKLRGLLSHSFFPFFPPFSISPLSPPLSAPAPPALLRSSSPSPGVLLSQ